jgi:hypothetical protein
VFNPDSRNATRGSSRSTCSAPLIRGIISMMSERTDSNPDSAPSDLDKASR